MKTAEEALSEAINAYLPLPLVARFKKALRRSTGWGEWITGSLTRCDITGFAAMSGSLAQKMGAVHEAARSARVSALSARAA